MKSRAFTLIELLVVISIIGLLSGVVMTSLNSAREKGRLAAAKHFSSGANRALADEAIGMWDFDEGSGTSTLDRSGNGYHGELMNGASFSPDTPSGTGYSVSLDGTNDYVRTTLSRSGIAPLTVSAWFRYTGSAGDGYRPILAGQSQDVFMGKTTGSSNIGIQDGNWNSAVAVGTNAWDGSWHHFAYVHSGGTGRVYLDGKEVGSASFSGGSGTIYFGYEAEGAGYYYRGLIDEMRIFRKALTASEVGNLYAQDASRLKVADK